MRPGHDWKTEYTIASTPVDVAGHRGAQVVLVELEWRRADPADNTAKLFRYLSEETVTADRVVVCQLFTEYYDLASGGSSSKRQNATFVGRVAADALPALSYHPLDVPLAPPKRGGDPPEDWEQAVANAAGAVADTVPSP
jgi:hypothetical protein